MAQLPLDAILGRRKRHADQHFPTDPVRKHSYDVNDRRAQPWRPIGTLPFGLAFREALVEAAEWLARKQHRERHSGDDRLQPKFVLVLKDLLSHLDFATGRLDPSWATLLASGGYERSTLDRALEALANAGFISQVRRTVRLEVEEGQPGPQRAQTSSATYFDCRRRMAADTYAAFYAALLRQLAKGGRWLKAQARRVERIFNSEAVPSLREPKIARLLQRARAEMAVAANPGARRVPVTGKPGRPDSVPTPAAEPEGKSISAGLRETLARMAVRLGLDPDDALGANPK